MKQNALGDTGVMVSELGFGGSTIGNLYRAVDDDTALAATAAAWEEGIRYFDTAPHYGLGLSERRLGRALQGRPRDKYTLSTKVGRLLAPNPSPTGSDLEDGGFAVPDDLVRLRSYTRDGVLRSIESSLERLGLDRIDIAYIHDPEDYMDAAVAEAAPTLADLRDQGVLGAVGAGMNYVEPLRRFVAETDVDVVMVAGRWTLVDQRAQPLLDDCCEAGVGVVVAAPFNSGLLARQEPAPDSMFDYDIVPVDVLDVARACARACERRRVELPAAALQFPLRHPAVASVVTGMRTPAQVQASAAWITMGIDARLWNELPTPARLA